MPADSIIIVLKLSAAHTYSFSSHYLSLKEMAGELFEVCFHIFRYIISLLMVSTSLIFPTKCHTIQSHIMPMKKWPVVQIQPRIIWIMAHGQAYDEQTSWLFEFSFNTCHAYPLYELVSALLSFCCAHCHCAPQNPGRTGKMWITEWMDW